ncbi:MAG: glycoside hydrolase family 9 protein, partial [Tannerella sp.]|nr:glycoside hydrolase family 9 protein [Tannerella sp.]
AQRQLDWIIGLNPFSSSTIVGVGYNQPLRMINCCEFSPPTPVLSGAVMNGLCGDKEDMPHLITYNNYSQSEYWMPAVAWTLWLMSEITK